MLHHRPDYADSKAFFWHEIRNTAGCIAAVKWWHSVIQTLVTFLSGSCTASLFRLDAATEKGMLFFSYVQKHLKKCLLNLLFSVATTLKTIFSFEMSATEVSLCLCSYSSSCPSWRAPILIVGKPEKYCSKVSRHPSFLHFIIIFFPIFIKNGLSGRVAINKPFYLSPVKGWWAIVVSLAGRMGGGCTGNPTLWTR